MSKEEVLSVEDFDSAAAPVGKKKCCSGYRERVLEKAKLGGNVLTGTWSEFKAFISKGNVFQMAYVEFRFFLFSFHCFMSSKTESASSWRSNSTTSCNR